MLSRLIPEERTALFMVLVALVIGLSWATIYRLYWILSFIPWLLFYMVFLGFTVGKALDAFWDRDLTRGLRWRKALAVPLIVGSFMVFDGVTKLTSRTSAYLFLWTHEDELDAAERKAGIGRPAVLPYLKGVPDSGSAIIRSSIDPTKLARRRQQWLVSGTILSCHRLRRHDWLCSYD